MAVALNEKDLNSPIADKLRAKNIDVFSNNDNLDPAKTRSLLVINPMPTENTQNNTTANIIDLFNNDQDIILRPTFWHIDIETDKKTATINFSDEKFDEIKQQNFDTVVSAGASVDHVEYDNIKNLDKLREVFRWATENTGGFMPICWSSMLAFNEFHNVPKFVNEENGKRIKIIGHFENTPTDNDTPYANALNEISVLPLGCTGYLRDKHLRDLEEAGKISILSETKDKTKIVHNSSIAIAIDNQNNILFWGPHPDYRPREHNQLAYVEGEVERDRNPEKAQPGVIINEVIGEDKFGKEFDWYKGASQICQIFHAESYKRNQEQKVILPATPSLSRPQPSIISYG